MRRILTILLCLSFITSYSQTYWKLDLQDEWRGTDLNWNNFQQPNSIIAAGNVTQNNLIKSDGSASTVSVTLVSGFNYNSATTPQGSDLGVFSDLVLGHGWYFSNGANFRFTGLNNLKYYTVYVLASSAPWESGLASFTISGDTSNITSTSANVGDRVSFPNWENDVALNKMVNVSPSGGIINVLMNLTGNGAMPAIVLKEQTGFYIPTNPAAPTSGIVDDVNNTFDFTFNPAYGLVSQYDYTLDSGFTWHTLQTKPIYINNVSIKSGFVGVRVKDFNDDGVGYPLWSNADFTITAPTASSSIITIKAVLSGTPVWTSKLVAAGLKYNKNGRFGMTMDDRGLTARDLSAYISGGVAPSNGQTYLGKTFTDGANVNGKTIKWSGSIATNAYANDTTTDASASGVSMTWAQVKPLVDLNWNLLDHGAFHGISGTWPAAHGFNTLMNAAQNRSYTYRKLSEQGDEYVMRYGVVPTNDKDYHAAWEQLGYNGGSSQGTYDGYPHQFGANNVTTWLTNRSYKVHLRYFADLRAEGVGNADRAQWIAAIDNVTSLSNSSTHYSSEVGMHYADIDSVITMMNYASTTFNNNIWVCGLQEFMEYFDVAQTTNIKQTISGDTLIVTLDQTYLNPEIRWRDMSFLLSSDKTISSVTVTGADDYSYNTSTGLINIYKKKTTGFEPLPNAYQTGFAIGGKVPLKPLDVFIDDNYDNPPSILVDGDTVILYNPKNTGSFMYPAPYDAVIDLQDWGVVVDSVKVRVNLGGTYTTKVILTRNDTEEEDSIGVFSQQSQARWLTFYPDTMNRFVSSRVILRTPNNTGFGTEVRVYGTYLPYGIEQEFTHRGTPLKYQLGVNTHWWYFINNLTGDFVEPVFSRLDTMRMYSIRNYGDTWDYQNESGSRWSFNPVEQGWREEDYTRRLKSQNPEVLYWSVMQGQTRVLSADWNSRQDSTQMMKAVITNLTSLGYGWNMTASVYWTNGTGGQVMSRAWVNPLSGTGVQSMSDSWQIIPTSLPSSLTWGIPNGNGYSVGDTVLFTIRHVSQLLTTYEGNFDRDNPDSWDSAARIAYVWAARKGVNTNATHFIPNGSTSDSVGLNLGTWAEFMNEPDKTWVGYDDYLNGHDLAVAWSKAYDNNKVYSSTLGMKNADTSMKMQTSGLAVSAAYPMKGADYKSKTLRGVRPKTNVGVQPMTWKARTFGWVDQPYDIIQFHNYSYTGGAYQHAGNVQSGLPVELGNVVQASNEFNLFRNKYAPFASLDAGEWGYDRSQNSPMNAPYIDNHNPEEVRAAWSVRTMLYNNVHGIDYSQWYRLFHEHAGNDTTDGVPFGTMSVLIDSLGNGEYIRFNETGYAFAQFNEFGDYVYDSTLREDSIYCYRFKKDTNYLITYWAVESSPNIDNWRDEKAIFHERTGLVNIPMAASSYNVRRLTSNTATMTTQTLTTTGGVATLSYSLSPTFIQYSQGGVIPNRKKRTITYY